MLRSLKADKASGPDGIPPRFLKEFADELVPVPCRLLHLILSSCTYPSSWKHALVRPVPKKGDRSILSNYRPIAFTLAVAKVFETLLNSHFIKHLESNNLLSDHQYGFRQARFTGVFFPILLMPGHPLLGTSENHSSSLLISLRHLTESGIRLCLPNFQLTAFLLRSVNSFPAFYPIALYLLLLTAQPLQPSWSPVVFLRVLSFHLLSSFSL